MSPRSGSCRRRSRRVGGRTVPFEGLRVRPGTTIPLDSPVVTVSRTSRPKESQPAASASRAELLLKDPPERDGFLFHDGFDQPIHQVAPGSLALRRAERHPGEGHVTQRTGGRGRPRQLWSGRLPGRVLVPQPQDADQGHPQSPRRQAGEVLGVPSRGRAARDLGALGLPLPPPPEEVPLHGRRHPPGSRCLRHPPSLRRPTPAPTSPV